MLYRPLLVLPVLTTTMTTMKVAMTKTLFLLAGGGLECLFTFSSNDGGGGGGGSAFG